MSSVTIRTIDDLENLINGTYGYGSSSDYLNVTLANDLDFSELDDNDSRKWNFGATGNPTFYMNFDGQGNSIKNLSFNSSANNFALFTNGGISGTLENLTVSDANVFAANVVIFAGNINPTIRHCHFSGHVSTSGTFSGLVAGMSDGRMDVCSFSGEVVAYNIEGILGGYCYVSRCAVWADITLTGSSGSVFFTGYGDWINNSSFICTLKPASAFGRISTISDNYHTCFNYLVIKNAADGAGYTSNIWGSNCVSCFYNNDVYDYGSDTANGTSSANLGSTSWMREKGYSI